MAVETNIRDVFAGTAFTITVSMDPAEDITGWSLAFTLKREKTDALALISKTVGAGITVTSAVNGIFVIAVDAADTEDLDAPADYVYDVERTDVGGEQVISYGQIFLDKKVR